MHAVPSRAAERRASFKPRAVEEPIDYYFHRPLAEMLVRVLLPLPVTPDQVTWASGFFGLSAGVAMGASHLAHTALLAVGAGLLLFSIVLDCADGQLARRRGTSSVVGRVLDGLVDFVAPLAVFHGLAVHLVAHGYSVAFAWGLGWAAGVSLLWHATQYDHAKNVHLHHASPDFSLGGRTLLGAEEVAALRDDFRQKGERFHAALMALWLRWFKAQRRGGSGALGRVSFELANEDERAAYRRHFAAQMRAWTWLGFGTHLFLLVVCALGACFDVRAIVIGWGVIVLPMNLAAAILLARRRGLEARFVAVLARLRAG